MPDIWLPLAMRAAMPTTGFEDIAPEKRDWYGGATFHGSAFRASQARQVRAKRAPNECPVEPTRYRWSTDPKQTIAVDPINDREGPNRSVDVHRNGPRSHGSYPLIACLISRTCNSRERSRDRKIGVRLCLGASRWRLIRQLLTESLLLSIVGGVAGVFLAWWTLNLFLSVVFVRYGGAEMMRVAISRRTGASWFILLGLRY